MELRDVPELGSPSIVTPRKGCLNWPCTGECSGHVHTSPITRYDQSQVGYHDVLRVTNLDLLVSIMPRGVKSFVVVSATGFEPKGGKATKLYGLGLKTFSAHSRHSALTAQLAPQTQLQCLVFDVSRE